MQVILAANELPSLNDVTYSELTEIISRVRKKKTKTLAVYDMTKLFPDSIMLISS